MSGPADPELAQLVDTIERGIRPEVDADLDRLRTISHAIHSNPELRFAEHQAAALLTHALTSHGFDVQLGIAGMKTAFRAERRIGTGDGPTVAVFCEYDALPGLGHGCGHNIIATAGLGGAVSAARWLDGDGAATYGANGRIVVLGSPGEEGGGGKVFLIEDGQLADIDAAVMVHPAGYDAVGRTNLGRMSLEARFTGRASHASAAPEFGRNALDAATLLLVAIGLLRQQLRPDSRIHAIVTDGGESINIIPAAATVQVFVRAEDPGYLKERLYEAIEDCVQGAARATQTTGVLEEVAKPYEPVLRNPVLADLAEHAYAAAGRPLDPSSARGGAGSTDMGNVSQQVPSIHPYIRVTPGTPLHTSEFVTAAGSADGDLAVVDGAVVLGTMVATLLVRPDLVSAARAAFEAGTS